MTSQAQISPDARSLARNALGFLWAKDSYRNGFVAVVGGANEREWLGLVAKGDAEVSEPYAYGSGQARTFWLTLQGALNVVDEGETLCDEDFPEVPVNHPARSLRIKGVRQIRSR